MIDMDAVIQFIMFGAEGTPGGVQAATELAAGVIVEESDFGDRPDPPFMTFDLLGGGGRPVYGPRHHPYTRVESHPTDETQCLLVFDNAEDLTLRIQVLGEQPDQNKATLYTLAKQAHRYFAGEAARDMRLAGISCYVVDPGEVRDARTALNLKTELRWAFDVTLRVEEAWTVAVPVWDEYTGTLAEDHGTEEDLEI